MACSPGRALTGEVRTFSYEPPKLSELFMEAVTPEAGGRDPGGGVMPRWRSIWLVARREILERGRSRGFILSVAFTTLIVVGSFIIPAIVFGGDNPTKVGIVEPSPPGLQAAIEQSAQRFDHKVAITTYPDAATADAALNDGGAEIVVDIPADLSGPGEIRVKRQPDQATAQVIAAATVALRVQAILGGSNVDQAALADAQRPPETTSLQAQTEQDQAKFLVANIGAVLILVGIFSFGFAVLTGVVEEKQSRVVEVVLSTVRARDLLMGKVLGIGVLGIVQLAVFIIGRTGRRARDGPSRAAHDDTGCGRAAGGLVRARVPALLDGAWVPRSARVADRRRHRTPRPR